MTLNETTCLNKYFIFNENKYIFLR